MYKQYFGFSASPFALTPDPSFMFESRCHKRALAYLEYGLNQADGFVIISGPAGTGKTTLVESLLKQLNKETTRPIKLVTSNLSSHELLRLIGIHLELSLAENLGKADLLQAIEHKLHQLHRQGLRVIVIVDEAHNMNFEALEELRMLSNFRSDGKPMLQSFLLGQERLREILQRPELEQFRQRVIAACHLQAMSEQETQSYIQYRLKAVGWNNHPVISNDALRLIYQYSQGIPRRINLLCDRLLLACFLEEGKQLTQDITLTVVEELVEETGQATSDPATGSANLPLTSEPSPDQARLFREHLQEVFLFLDTELSCKLKELEKLDAQIKEKKASLKNLSASKVL